VIDRTTAPTDLSDQDKIKQLTAIWQELLGLPSVGPDDNFFDLGGDSALAVHLFSRIEKSFNINLPLATLFEAPTIAELSRLLVNDAPASNGWSSLVAIQPSGSRPNLFCMHGAGGTVLIYRELSEHLSNDQPFYGLQAQGLDGSSPLLTKIEDMAARYVKEIRRVQPHGPYYLGGYCMGGTVAYEVAQQLLAQGEPIAFLGLFDTMNWKKLPVSSPSRRAYQEVERLFFHLANFLKLDFAGQSKFFSEKMAALKNRLPVWKGMILAKFSSSASADNSESLLLGQVWRTNDTACNAYDAKPFRGTITDFRPLKQYRWFDKADAKWEKLALGGLKIVQLQVYPAGMLVEPFVSHLAVALKTAMDEAIRVSGAQKE
jgi:thioesterase domain-containing protein/acyl carrier protein